MFTIVLLFLWQWLLKNFKTQVWMLYLAIIVGSITLTIDFKIFNI